MAIKTLTSTRTLTTDIKIGASTVIAIVINLLTWLNSILTHIETPIGIVEALIIRNTTMVIRGLAMTVIMAIRPKVSRIGSMVHMIMPITGTAKKITQKDGIQKYIPGTQILIANDRNMAVKTLPKSLTFILIVNTHLSI